MEDGRYQLEWWDTYEGETIRIIEIKRLGIVSIPISRIDYEHTGKVFQGLCQSSAASIRPILARHSLASYGLFQAS